MPVVQSEVLEFLDGLNQASIDIDRNRGIHAVVYKRIDSAEQLGMIAVTSGDNTDAGLDGRRESVAYFFRAATFLPVIKELMANGRADIGAVVMADEGLDGVYVVEKSRWDRSYSSPSPDNNGYASVQRGHVKGTIRLEREVIAEFDLTFTPTGEIRELRSDIGRISRAEIYRAVKLEESEGLTEEQRALIDRVSGNAIYRKVVVAILGERGENEGAVLIEAWDSVATYVNNRTGVLEAIAESKGSVESILAFALEYQKINEKNMVVMGDNWQPASLADFKTAMETYLKRPA